MSVQKVIYNNYTEILDYMRAMEKKFAGLENYFDTLKDSSQLKKALLDRLSDTTVSIEMTFNANIAFWDKKKKTQDSFLAMCIVFIIITFIMVFFVFFMMKVSELDMLKTPNKTFEKGRSFFMHLIIYMCFLSVFIVMIINIKGNIDLCKGQREKLLYEMRGRINNEINVGYIQYIVKDVTHLDFYKLMLQFGYKKRSMARKVELPQELASIADYDTLYETFGNEIAMSLKNFYNNGKGYMETRKIYVMSNPINMLKESNRIMDYYNYIALKRNNEKTSEEQMKKIIDELVVSQLKKVSKNNANTTPTDQNSKDTIIQNNEANVDFSNSLQNLVDAYRYLLIYLYPLYIKADIHDASVPEIIRKSMPNNVNIKEQNSISGKDRSSFLSNMKIIFDVNYKSKYAGYVNSAKAAGENMDDVIKQALLDFVPYFRRLYYHLFLDLTGTYWFPFEKEYMVDRKILPLFSATDAGPLGSTAASYKSTVMKQVEATLIETIKSSFNHVAAMRAYIIEEISNSMLPYEIFVIKYQSYIVTQVLKGRKYTSDDIDMYNQLVLDIDKTLRLKKQLRENTVDKKFVDPQEFVEVLNGLSYQDMLDGLNTKYYQEIVNAFYKSVSYSVNSKENGLNNLDNIYYNSLKLYKMWKVTVFLTTVIIVFVWMYFMVGLAEEWRRISIDIAIKKQMAYKSENIDNISFVNKESMNRMMNLTFKLVVPLFLAIFIISLLFSFQKKSLAAFDFNRELIETNTMELKDAITELNETIDEITENINPVDFSKKIETLEGFSTEKKTDIYELVKKIIDKYDKCNYIVEAQKSKLPFPYTEVVMNGFIILVIVLCFFYILGQIKPVKRIYNIKELNKMKEEAIYMSAAQFEEMKKMIEYERSCHEEDIDTIIFTLKVIFFLFIVLFLMYYSTQIISSTGQFKAGLYNSLYFENSSCYPQ